MPIKPSLSDWLQFLESKASLKTSQQMGMSSIFIVCFMGLLSIYYIIGELIQTIIGTSALVIFYYGIISKLLNQISNESQKAEDLLNDIMNERIDGIEQIRERWFGVEENE